MKAYQIHPPHPGSQPEIPQPPDMRVYGFMFALTVAHIILAAPLWFIIHSALFFWGLLILSFCVHALTFIGLLFIHDWIRQKEKEH